MYLKFKLLIFFIFVLSIGFQIKTNAGEKYTKSKKKTKIGKLAASMKPGEMKLFDTLNFSRKSMDSHYEWEADSKAFKHDIIDWSHDGEWNTKTRQLFYFGIGHYTSPKFVVYSADTNKWEILKVPTWADKRLRKEKKWIVGHTYNRLGLSSKHGLYVVNWFGLHVYNIETKAWSDIKGTTTRGKDAYKLLEYFPEMGGFVYTSNWGKNLLVWDVAKKTSRRLGSYPYGIHGFMNYNPVYKAILFGGGNRSNSLYLLNSKGKVKKLKAPPFEIVCTNLSPVTCDPVSGEYLIQGLKTEGLFAYHPIKDKWKALSIKVPVGLVTRVDNYGVVMYCSNKAYKGKRYTCYLYKHKPAFSQKKK